METPATHQRLRHGFSMSEILVAVAVIGILSLIAIPTIRGLSTISNSKTKRNAQMTAEVSGNLTALNVAHVLPESLGGVEATTRLLQAGIKISDGPMAGTYMGMPGLQEKDIQPTSRFLGIVFDEKLLRLEYKADEFD
jgi:prepilin-type N-terminal cleavage/methylation domain-containing protein